MFSLNLLKGFCKKKYYSNLQPLLYETNAIQQNQHDGQNPFKLNKVHGSMIYKAL